MQFECIPNRGRLSFYTRRWYCFGYFFLKMQTLPSIDWCIKYNECTGKSNKLGATCCHLTPWPLGSTRSIRVLSQNAHNQVMYSYCPRTLKLSGILQRSPPLLSLPSPSHLGSQCSLSSGSDAWSRVPGWTEVMSVEDLRGGGPVSEWPST